MHKEIRRNIISKLIFVLLVIHFPLINKAQVSTLRASTTNRSVPVITGDKSMVSSSVTIDESGNLYANNLIQAISTNSNLYVNTNLQALSFVAINGFSGSGALLTSIPWSAIVISSALQGATNIGNDVLATRLGRSGVDYGYTKDYIDIVSSNAAAGEPTIYASTISGPAETTNSRTHLELTNLLSVPYGIMVTNNGSAMVINAESLSILFTNIFVEDTNAVYPFGGGAGFSNRKLTNNMAGGYNSTANPVNYFTNDNGVWKLVSALGFYTNSSGGSAKFGAYTNGNAGIAFVSGAIRLRPVSVTRISFAQLNTAPTANELVAPGANTTNYTLQCVNGVLAAFWTDGTTVYSNHIAGP